MFKSCGQTASNLVGVQLYRDVQDWPVFNTQTVGAGSCFNSSEVTHAIYLPFPSLADTERAGEDSLGLLAEGGPDSRTLSAIFLTN